jgi:hypothetical protein
LREQVVNDGPVFSRAGYEEHVAKLREACGWLGLGQGRAVAYPRLIAEFFGAGARTMEHVLAYNESCEVVDLFELWGRYADDFPGLRERLREVCRKGPTLREAEKATASSNRPRNDAFSYLLGGTLISAGVPVVAVEGVKRAGFNDTSDADITFMSSGIYIDVECKRPQADGAVLPRMREARGQLEKPTREGRFGIVALDCSVVARPPGTLLEYDSGEKAEAKISARLQALVPAFDPHLTPQVLGVILFARVAGMMRIDRSPILSPLGEPVRKVRPETIATWLVVGNAQAEGPDVLSLGASASRFGGTNELGGSPLAAQVHVDALHVSPALAADGAARRR